MEPVGYLKLPATRTFKIVAIGVIPAVIFSAWLLNNDPNLSAVEKFIESNTQVSAAVGEIDHLSLKNRTVFFRPSGVGAAQETDRIQYRYLVSGKSGNASVKVTMHISGTGETGKIEIESINR